MLKAAAQQAGKIAQDTLEQAVKMPGEVAGRALEQMGLSSQKPTDPFQKQADEQKAMIEKAKVEDAAISQKLIAQIEAEIERYRQERKQQKTMMEKQEEQKEIEESQATPRQFKESPSKLKGGFIGVNRRVKSAQDQSQPETSALRSGG